MTEFTSFDARQVDIDLGWGDNPSAVSKEGTLLRAEMYTQIEYHRLLNANAPGAEYAFVIWKEAQSVRAAFLATQKPVIKFSYGPDMATYDGVNGWGW